MKFRVFMLIALIILTGIVYFNVYLLINIVKPKSVVLIEKKIDNIEQRLLLLDRKFEKLLNK